MRAARTERTNVKCAPPARVGPATERTGYRLLLLAVGRSSNVAAVGALRRKLVCYG